MEPAVGRSNIVEYSTALTELLWSKVGIIVLL